MRVEFQKARRVTGQPGIPARDCTGGVPVHAMQTLTGLSVSSGALTINTDPAYCYASQAKSVKCVQSAASTDVDISVREDFRSGANPLIIPILTMAADGAIDDQIRVRITDSQGFGTAYVSAQLPIFPGAWQPLAINLSQLVADTGTVDMSDIRTIRLTYLNGANTNTFYIGRITAGRRIKPMFFWRTDDGYDNVRTVLKPILASYGWVACVGATNYFYGRSGAFMGTAAAFLELQNAGWPIVNHTYDHPQLVTSGYTQAQCEAQFTNLISFYSGLGVETTWMRKFYIAPYGEVDSTVRAALVAQGFQIAVTTKRGKQTTNDNPPYTQIEDFKYGNALNMRIINPRHGTYKTAATLLAELDQCIVEGGITCIMLHSTPSAAAGDSGDDLVYNSGDISAFAAGVRVRERQGRLKVVNPKDLVDMDLSALTEPSLETLAPGSCPGLTGWATVGLSNVFSDVGSTPASVDGAVLRLGAANSINWDAPSGTGGVLRAVTNNGASFHAIEFNSTLGSLVSGTLNMTQPCSIFVVARILTKDTGTLNQFFVDGNGASNRMAVFCEGSNAGTSADYFAATCGTNLVGASGTAPEFINDTGWHLFELHAEGAKSCLYVDGDCLAGDANTQNTTTLTLGNRYVAAASAGTNVQVAGIYPAPLRNLRRSGLADHLRAHLMPLFGITPRVPLTGHYRPRLAA